MSNYQHPKYIYIYIYVFYLYIRIPKYVYIYSTENKGTSNDSDSSTESENSLQILDGGDDQSNRSKKFNNSLINTTPALDKHIDNVLGFSNKTISDKSVDNLSKPSSSNYNLLPTFDKYSTDKEKSDIKVDKEDKIKNQNFKDSIEIQYLYIKKSEYSGIPVWGLYDKESLYSKLWDDEPSARNIDYKDFEPSGFGCQIGRITENGKCIFKANLDDETDKILFSYSLLDETLFKKHEIIYKVPDLKGYCDGKFGIICLTNCDPSCRTQYTWLLNGVIYKSESFLYWVEVDPNAVNDFTCTVSCKKENSESKINIPYLREINFNELKGTLWYLVLLWEKEVKAL